MGISLGKALIAYKYHYMVFSSGFAGLGEPRSGDFLAIHRDPRDWDTKSAGNAS